MKSEIKVSTARWNFVHAQSDVWRLISLHDSMTGKKVGRPYANLEALKKSAIILTVTSWESYVEDTVAEQLEIRLTQARSPADMSSVFNGVAHEWLDFKKRKPTELQAWANEGWKIMIRESLKTKLDDFHSPNAVNVQNLFRKYLNVKLQWAWKNCDCTRAEKRLNALIHLRGRCVHRGKAMPSRSSEVRTIRRAEVMSAVELVENLVSATDSTLGIAPKEKPTPPPRSPWFEVA